MLCVIWYLHILSALKMEYHRGFPFEIYLSLVQALLIRSSVSLNGNKNIHNTVIVN